MVRTLYFILNVREYQGKSLKNESNMILFIFMKDHDGCVGNSCRKRIINELKPIRNSLHYLRFSVIWTKVVGMFSENAENRSELRYILD